MSETLPIDLSITPVFRERNQFPQGGLVRTEFEVRDRATGDLVEDVGIVSALVWLPGTTGSTSPGQPATALQVSPGRIAVDWLSTIPGTYTVWIAAEGPTPEVAYSEWDAYPTGQGSHVPGTGNPWSDVAAATAAAAVSAALAAARSEVGRSAAPYVQAASDSAEEAGLQAREAASQRQAAELVAATAAASVTEAAIPVLTRAELDALTSIPGTSPPQPLRDLMLATVLGEGWNYRRRSGTWVRESRSTVLIDAVVEALRGILAPTGSDSFTVEDSAGGVLAEITSQGEIAGQGLRVTSSLPIRDAVGRLMQTLATGDGTPLVWEDGSGGVVGEVNQAGRLSWAELRALAAELLEARVPGGSAGTTFVAEPGRLSLHGMQMVPGEAAGLAFEDAHGQVIGEIEALGRLAWGEFAALAAELLEARVPGGAAGSTFTAAPGRLALHGMHMLPAERPGLSFEDEFGQVFFEIDGSSIGGETGDGDYSQDEINAANAVAMAHSQGLRGTPLLAWAGMVYAVCQILAYGQSLEVGQASYPVLSKSPRYGALMCGDSPRGAVNGPTTTSWAPAGGAAAYKPLREVVQNVYTGAIYTDAEVAALARDTEHHGETPAAGMMHQYLRLRLARREIETADRAFVVTNCGIAGRAIRRLNKGYSTPHYNRIPDAVLAVRNSPDRAGRSHGVPLIVFDQGQFDSINGTDATPTKAGYKAEFISLDDNMAADIAAITGQARRPVLLINQIGGGYARDNATGSSTVVDPPNALAIGQAQLELALEREHIVMVGPDYTGQDVPSGHITANAGRQQGALRGKVMALLEAGQSWEPMRPLSWRVRGRTVLAAFHCPVGPIQVQSPFLGMALRSHPLTLGATFYDGASGTSPIPIVASRVAASQVVTWTLGREPVGQLRVLLGDRTVHGGVTNLCDSDPTVCDDVWEYTAGGETTGQYPAENVPDLVGRPLPLVNWCVAGNWLVTADNP